MLYDRRIGISEGIDINKWNASKEFNISHYWYFSTVYLFQLYFWNGCHNVLMMSLKLSVIAILSINSVDYCCIITGISKYEAVNVLQKADLNEKRRILQNRINLFLNIKMDKYIITFGNIEVEKSKFYRYRSRIFFMRCRYWERISI